MADVLSLEEALAVVLDHAARVARVRATEVLRLREAHGRVLAEAIAAPREQPPFPRSTRDGFAVRASEIGKPLKVIGLVKAGERWAGPAMGTGEAIELMTGAPLPEGADAVVMVEHVAVDGGVLHVADGRKLRAGENVVPRGAEAHSGDVMVAAGTLLDAPAIAAAASCGAANVTVVAKPVMSIVATGDELVELDQTPEEWQIHNSNSYSLRALAAAEGAYGGMVQVARDTRDDLRYRIAQGETSDLLVLSGGVSMGKYDLVEEVLAEYGAEFFFTGARIQPGKPVVFGRLPKSGVVGEKRPSPWSGEWTYFFGLPGNPVSTDVCFRLFVAPMLRALSGRKDLATRFVEATVSESFEGKPGLVRFLPAVLEGDWRGVSVRPVTWQGSGDVAANGRASAYCVVEERGLAVGDVARVLLR